ncbi:DNA-deoxyinosine glycosylase [Zoogloea sp.]|uniref:DNA-deoxyinosine glycosylase n=1 Tax=Zoogloea sp. TaxID=49181 RepID=UPI0035B4399D
MALLHSFPPVSAADAHTLILGSMPGQASLAAGEYYAHPRNLFWPILGELFGAPPALPYAERLGKLTTAGLALWDVLQCCEREGSLDGNIEPTSIVANDFASFLAGHPHIVRIFFNGAMAETCFRRHVQPTLPPRPLLLTRLPSTSPANAGYTFARRLEAWRALALPPGGEGSGAWPDRNQRSST